MFGRSLWYILEKNIFDSLTFFNPFDIDTNLWKALEQKKMSSGSDLSNQLEDCVSQLQEEEFLMMGLET